VSADLCILFESTENAGREKERPNFQGKKNAGTENAEPKNARLKMQNWKVSSGVTRGGGGLPRVTPSRG